MAQIILLSAKRLPVLEVAQRTDASRLAVWRWQLRFAEQGVDGLLRDNTRKPDKPALSLSTVARILELPCSNPPGAATHWTGCPAPCSKLRWRNRCGAPTFHE